MDITNGLFVDSILLIFPYLKFYEQHTLAKINKLFYTKYCEYKKKVYHNEYKYFVELFKSKNLDLNKDKLSYGVRKNGSIELLIPNMKPQIHYLLDGKSPNDDHTIAIGIIDVYFVDNDLKYNSHMHLHNTKHEQIKVDNIDFISLWRNTRNVMNMSNYNKAKTIDCPNVNHFIGIFNGGAWNHKFLGLKFSHIQKNCCSFTQYKSEIIALYKLFYKLSSNKFTDDFLENWLICEHISSDLHFPKHVFQYDGCPTDDYKSPI